METTAQLDAHSDSRKVVPTKYVWGQFTPDVEGVGYTDLPEQDFVPANGTIAMWNGIQLVQIALDKLMSSFSLIASQANISDWNYITSFPGYSIVHTVKDSTLNSPENVTSDWMVEVVKYQSTFMVTATRLDNPNSRYIRTYYNGNWSSWVLPYATYRP